METKMSEAWNIYMKIQENDLCITTDEYRKCVIAFQSALFELAKDAVQINKEIETVLKTSESDKLVKDMIKQLQKNNQKILKNVPIQ